jgi:hypothetical protein
MQDPNPYAEVPTALELQMQYYEEQLRPMHRPFEEHLVAMRESVCDKIPVQFTEVTLCPEAQNVATEEEEVEGELLRATVEDVDSGGMPS